jgi:hypothetical protein
VRFIAKLKAKIVLFQGSKGSLESFSDFSVMAFNPGSLVWEKDWGLCLLGAHPVKSADDKITNNFILGQAFFIKPIAADG